MKTLRLIPFLFLFLACSSEDDSNGGQPTPPNPNAPEVETTELSEKQSKSVKSGGSITDDKGFFIEEKGVVWDTIQSPNYDNSNKTNEGQGASSYSSEITGLEVGVTYSIRAYARSSEGVGYGNTIVYSPVANVPTVQTKPIFITTNSTATSGGEVIDDKGFEVIERGAVWGENDNPTYENSNKTTDGKGLGMYSSAVTGLEEDRTYFLRAYAKTSEGIGYGESLQFKTQMSLVDNDGNIYKTVKIYDQVWMAENLRTTRFNNGDFIEEVLEDTSWGSKVLNGEFIRSNVLNDPLLEVELGYLYSFSVVTSSNNVCPSGWHIPSQEEFLTLIENFPQEGGKSLKTEDTIFWKHPNIANNISKFSAKGSGLRGDFGFLQFKERGYFFSRTENPDPNDEFIPVSLLVENDDAMAYLIAFPGIRETGGSIRCIKD